MSEDIERVTDPADPERCQFTMPTGQCLNRVLPERQYCKAHILGNIEMPNRKSLSNYRLTKWHARIQAQADAPGIKSLRDEIGILRILLEEQLNKCHNNTDLLLNSTIISELVLKVEKLVTSCHRLEGSMGQLMDKAAILQFASEVITIISAELSSQPEIIDKIGSKIMELISRNEQNE